ncbi:hypothetical protein N473_01515 [Pseudoalteromonas luteoviolacea CPMOR-1]|uniref:Helix-turn-helix domain-containing protein n=1 Tax=Pseudoalteromonas luteoviolacea CPMOR-1 TaxID=1365248 RepID=A0A167LV29_9GAMM|nr:YdaS family helix-turn-helix protein [Pseudoalteromonas luteoviolacea]KZN65275.1 hypothetical protein N473_01515 [Pseudoalteromonas luteoviolacea CPMOR-1]
MSGKALKAAISIAGSQTKLAGQLPGVAQQNISYWLKRGGIVPAEHVIEIEKVTGVSRAELRPDLFGQ